MSMSVGQYGANSSIYILSQSIRQNEESQASVSWQLGSGTISSTIGGLGDNRQFALQLSSQMATNNAYQSNVSSLLNRLDLSAKGLKQLSSVAQDIYKTTTEMLAVENQGDSSSAAASSAATSDLGIIKQALNTVDNTGGYVFTGGDGRQIPLPQSGPLSDTPLARKINDLVSDMISGNMSADEVFTKATQLSSDNSADISLFDPTLSLSPADARKTRKEVVIGDRDETWTGGVVATEGNEAPSDTTTGSPIRNLIRNTMLVSALGNHKMTEPGMEDLVKKIQNSSHETSNNIIDMEASTGSDQNALESQRGALKSVGLMLTDYMGDNINTDPAALALKSDNLRAQLQTSFTLISKMKDLSLANYI